MKTWNKPMMEELNVNATAYAPESGTTVDGSYVSKDGLHTYYTYAPSGGTKSAQ